MKKILLGLFTISTLTFSQFVIDSKDIIRYTNSNGTSTYYVGDKTAHIENYNLWVEIPNWTQSGAYFLTCFDDNCKGKEEIKTKGIYNDYLNVHMLKVTPEILELLKSHKDVFISNYNKNRGMLVKLKDFNKLYNEIIVEK